MTQDVINMFGVKLRTSVHGAKDSEQNKKKFEPNVRLFLVTGFKNPYGLKPAGTRDVTAQLSHRNLWLYNAIITASVKNPWTLVRSFSLEWFDQKLLRAWAIGAIVAIVTIDADAGGPKGIQALKEPALI
ncbi:hypothetical protein GGX14DRAFT_388247 [Mycena pura]|uniref:Uncharacterized protein n=1 Tax=Mycena pura TaxID=153505 RepID=A0AAD6YL41_9AGAR|nr:hypothetical protein GGX14DRAFT_388247 [Mycena pura]